MIFSSYFRSSRLLILIFSSATCPTGFVMHRKSCYFISPKVTATFSDARRRCKSLGADLAMIKSANENNFLYNLVKISAAPKPAWIGLKRKADNKFYWLDNTPVEGNYQRWKDGEPNDSGGNEDCGHMLTHKNVPWNDASCSASGVVALCQKPLWSYPELLSEETRSPYQTKEMPPWTANFFAKASFDSNLAKRKLTILSSQSAKYYLYIAEEGYFSEWICNKIDSRFYPGMG